jgi:hypothetical protein
MDLFDLKRLALTSREISVAVGPADALRHVTLRLPTKHETNLAALRSGMRDAENDKAATVVLQRALLVGSVVAWSGVVAGDVLPHHPQAADPLLIEPGAVDLLLDAQPDWATTLGMALMTEMAARSVKQDTATKN